MSEKKEIWKSLDFMGFDGYEVSNWGRVKSLNYRHKGIEGILKQGKDRYGYLFVVLCQNRERKTFTVHRLVCLTFLENPLNLPQINHKDENKENNCLNNLEWVSPKENINYGTRNDKVRKAHKGKPHYKQRKPILQYTKEGEFIREWDSITTVSKELNLNKVNICMCCKKKLKTAYGFIWRYKE